MNCKKIRLQKWMAHCEIASRRSSEKLIEEKKVKVNGRVAKLGDKIDPNKDLVVVNNKKLRQFNNKKYYIMLNKPRGYITTMNDEKNRKCVADLVKDVPVKLFPVGRLDKDSEGLLLMTNDGDFANNISHPSTHVEKTYRVTVRSSITEEQLVRLSVGVTIDDVKTKPCDVNVISQAKDRSVLEFVLVEGRNRQIRKMCEQVGLEVSRLRRIKVGQIKLGMLKIGDWRELNENEKISLKRNKAK